MKDARGTCFHLPPLRFFLRHRFATSSFQVWSHFGVGPLPQSADSILDRMISESLAHQMGLNTVQKTRKIETAGAHAKSDGGQYDLANDGKPTINNGLDGSKMLDEYASTAFADEEDQEALETIAQFSPALAKKMREMRAYASRYHVDLYRAFKEAGGRLTQDGDGALAKTKFRAALLGTFNRMQFSSEILDEIFMLYGTGPRDTSVKRNLAARVDSAGRDEGMPGLGPLGYLDVKWIRFANSVGEHYDTYPPIDGVGSDGPAQVAGAVILPNTGKAASWDETDEDNLYMPSVTSYVAGAQQGGLMGAIQRKNQFVR